MNEWIVNRDSYFLYSFQQWRRETAQIQNEKQQNHPLRRAILSLSLCRVYVKANRRKASVMSEEWGAARKWDDGYFAFVISRGNGIRFSFLS